MRVVFQKHKRGLCTWTAYPPKRRPVSAGGGGSTGKCPLPHDLAQLIVERELALEFGFWGCVAHGATFRTLVGGGRKRTEPGVAFIRAHAGEIDEAEHLFHRHVGWWLTGSPTPARAALNQALEQWASIGEHQMIEVTSLHGAAPAHHEAHLRRPERAGSGSSTDPADESFGSALPPVRPPCPQSGRSCWLTLTQWGQ